MRCVFAGRTVHLPSPRGTLQHVPLPPTQSHQWHTGRHLQVVSFILTLQKMFVMNHGGLLRYPDVKIKFIKQIVIHAIKGVSTYTWQTYDVWLYPRGEWTRPLRSWLYSMDINYYKFKNWSQGHSRGTPSLVFTQYRSMYLWIIQNV